VLLLFTAAIVSNIESVQQTLNIALDAAYMYVFIPVEVLIWIRSLAIVLLIVAHALRHVQIEPEQSARTSTSASQPASLVLTSELVEALRAALTQVTVSEEPESPQALPGPQDEQRAGTVRETSAERDCEQETDEDEQEVDNSERVKAYLATHPAATDREIADALMISRSTVNKWRKRQRMDGQSEQ
jgi:hypothetical protein